MEVSRPGWKLHGHNLLHNMSELAYFSSLFLEPLSHLHVPFANREWEALTDGWALGREREVQCFLSMVQCR